MKNNHLEPTIIQDISSREDLVVKFENMLESLSERGLDLVIKKLNYLCLNFDPYSDGMPQEVENIINEFSLQSFVSNPFEFTNIVLQILDKTENKIKSRVH